MFDSFLDIKVWEDWSVTVYWFGEKLFWIASLVGW